MVLRPKVSTLSEFEKICVTHVLSSRPKKRLMYKNNLILPKYSLSLNPSIMAGAFTDEVVSF